MTHQVMEEFRVLLLLFVICGWAVVIVALVTAILGSDTWSEEE